MNKNPEFITAKPNNKLHKFISYYYFQKESDENKITEFIYFPHFINGLTIYKNSEILKKIDSFEVIPNDQIGYSISYATIHNTSRLIKIRSPFNKIGIAFNPLGINNFIKGNLSSKITKDSFQFNYFGKDFENCLDSVYNETEIDKKAKLLDSFFVSKLQLFESTLIKQAIELIHSKNEKLTVQYIAERLGTNRRTLLREFNKHLCCSVKMYIDTVQFRRAFNAYQLAENKPKLTQLTYDFNYFDQSEFVKHFKKITKSKPSHILKSVTHLGTEDTYWQIKN